MLIQTKSAAVAASRIERKVEHLMRPFEIKSFDETRRTFTGLAAAFTLDQGGDIILPGAFKRTLSDWKRTKGNRIIYLIDSHNYFSVRNVVGKMTEAEENAEGLSTEQQVLNSPDGEEVWQRVIGGYINAMSIGFQTIEQRVATEAEQRTGIFRYLKEIRLKENSLVIWPMNENARLDAIKGILDAAKDRPLTEEELEEVKTIHLQLSALLSLPSPGAGAPASEEVVPQSTTQEDSAQAPPAQVTDAMALAPDDPRRLAMEETLRSLTLHSLSTSQR